MYLITLNIQFGSEDMDTEGGFSFKEFVIHFSEVNVFLPLVASNP